jgi:hypothetical protein
MSLSDMAEPMEHRTIARECAADFGRILDSYRTHYKLTTEQAIARMGENAEEYAQHVLQRPPNEIAWHEINHVGELDPPRALELWEEIKTQARMALLRYRT